MRVRNLSVREPGDLRAARHDGVPGRVGKAMRPKPAMNGPQKSDRPVVPAKPPNNAATAATEEVEGRGLATGNAVEQNATRTQRRIVAPSALERVRQAAIKDRKAKFTALLHHVTIDRLRAAYEALARRAAPGVDGVKWADYGEGLEARLVDLHARLLRGAYRAKHSRRVFIPKPDGRHSRRSSRTCTFTTCFDLWVEQWRKRNARGDVAVIRYADDFVLGFQYEADARRFRDDLEVRLRRFHLELHPEKTRLFRFGKNAKLNHRERGLGKPTSFEFLGFTRP